MIGLWFRLNKDLLILIVFSFNLAPKPAVGINTTIIYPENKKLSDDDRNYDASLYEITLHGKVIVIALGQPNIDYLDKEIIFYPVYKIENDKVVSKIGLYEINDSIQYSIFDDEGDIDLTKVGEIFVFWRYSC